MNRLLSIKIRFCLFCRRLDLSEQCAELVEIVGDLDILRIVATDHPLGLQVVGGRVPTHAEHRQRYVRLLLYSKLAN